MYCIDHGVAESDVTERLSLHFTSYIDIGFPGGSNWKGSMCSAGDLGLIPGLGRSPGEVNGYPLQYSGLENSMYGTSPLGHIESDMSE